MQGVTVGPAGLTNIGAPMTAIAGFTIGPSSGPAAGGTTVTISGTGLSQATAVTFGLTKSKPTDVADDLLTVVAPAHAAGTVSVSVITPSGTTNSLNFTYT